MEKVNKTRVLFVGVGGQGVLRASQILGEALTLKGIPTMMSEIHGMAQRGGVVECTLVWGAPILDNNKNDSEYNLIKTKQSVYSPMIGTGQADIAFSLEPLEAYRSQKYYHNKTLVLMNTRKMVPTSVTLGGGQYPSVEKMIKELETKVNKVYPINASQIAIDTGSEKVSNIVLLGAMWKLGLVPLQEQELWLAIEGNIPKKAIELNKKAFKEGQKAVS